MTLIELLVVLAIIALAFTVSGLALRGGPPATTSRLTSILVSARRRAIDSGYAISEVVAVHQRTFGFTAFPDGSVVADSGLAIDRFTGVRSAEFDQRTSPAAP